MVAGDKGLQIEGFVATRQMVVGTKEVFASFYNPN